MTRLAFRQTTEYTGHVAAGIRAPAHRARTPDSSTHWMTIMPTNSAAPRSLPTTFSPDWGKESWRLWELLDACDAGVLVDTVEALIASTPDRTRDEKAVRFSCSLLADILRAGGSAWVRDSKLLVSWPDWDGPAGRESAREAMESARDMRALNSAEVAKVASAFAQEIDGEEFSAALASCQFRLVPATDTHPSGTPYHDIFAAALRYWSMPYRGRSGRMKRFVITAEHDLFGNHPVVAGIVELGDEAPFCTWRDTLLGLSSRSLAVWLEKQDRTTAARIAERFKLLRRCLRKTSDGLNLSTVAASRVVSRREELTLLAKGRSNVLADQGNLLKDRKRVAYGLRLAQGELALAAIAAGGPINPKDRDFAAGVRAVHDLVIPRTHFEATVCGALPPFSIGLGGKLVVAFLSHPAVIASTQNAEGELLSWSFDTHKLGSILPSHGMLCLTTKGLYSRHAPMYSRSEMPGRDGVLRFRHLANTDGATTTLVSERTTRLARSLLDARGGDSARVSSLYGSGGAKRHRAIEAATIMAGLSAGTSSAGIRRPVYGALFVKNPEAICWLGDAPDWQVSRDEPSSFFCERAAEVWRQRWLARAQYRLRDYVLLPSHATFLRNQVNSRERSTPPNG